jgi:predicted lysophospholipase L1 biosynthesis ABC-type transport system permease subunit
MENLARRVEVKTMDAMVIGAAFVGSVAAAFVVQRAVLGTMFRAFGRDKAKSRYSWKDRVEL